MDGPILHIHTYVPAFHPSFIYILAPGLILFLPRVHLYTAQRCHNRFLASETNIVAAI